MLLIAVIQICLATLTWAQVSIDTPTLIRCEPTTINWSGGSFPYMVYVYPNAYLDEQDYYEKLGPFDESSTTYTANLAAGEKLRINVRDIANPDIDGSEFTDAITIESGISNFCLATGPTGGGVHGPAAPSGLGDPLSGIDDTSSSRSTRTSSIPSSAGTTPSDSVSLASSGAAFPSVTRSVGGGNGDGNSDAPSSGPAKYSIYPFHLFIAIFMTVVVSF